MISKFSNKNHIYIQKTIRYYINNKFIINTKLSKIITQRLFSSSLSFLSSTKSEKIISNNINLIQAKFASTLKEQILFFKNNGFVLIKRSSNQNINNINLVNEEIISYFQSETSSWKYKIERFLGINSVGTPFKRYSIKLPLLHNIKKFLSSTIIDLNPFLSHILKPNAVLVELSTLVSGPGSHDQAKHSDISYSNAFILSGFIATSQVLLSNGPTCLYPGTHSKAYHRRIPKKRNNIYYSPEGEAIELEPLMSANIEDGYDDETLEETLAADIAFNCDPQTAILEIGDILLFDTKIFHYGSANLSSVNRALLSFSFQERNSSGNIENIEGFTYHYHDSLIKNDINLKDFPL